MFRNQRPLTRRAPVLLAGTVAALLGIIVTSSGPVYAAATNAVWRTDGYGPGNTGYNPNETAITTSTVPNLEYGWSVVSPVVRYSCSQQSAPVVANGKMYLTDQGGIGAYDVKTGARVWRYTFASAADEVTPRLTIVGTRLLAAFNSCISQSDPDGRLRAFDADTGAELWTVRRDAPMYTMVVDKDIVVVSGQDVYEPAVTAYRVSDGDPLWTRTGLLPKPVSANGRLLLTRYEEPGSDLVDIRTGNVLWSSATTYSVLAAGPSGGPLYAAGPANALVRLNVETGAQVWSVPNAAAQLSVDDSRLYVAQDSALVVREAATGNEVWRESFASQLGKPVIAGGVVYATVSGRLMYPLHAATGEALDDEPPYSGAIGHPVVVNGRLYVTDGRVLDMYRL